MNNIENYPDIIRLAKKLAVERLAKMEQETEESVIYSYSADYRKGFVKGFMEEYVEGCSRLILVVREYVQKDSIEKIAEDNGITTKKVKNILAECGLLDA